MTFLILVGLIIWVYFDNQICELSRIKNDRIRKIEHILNIELNNDWFIRRYKTICILRYFLLTILFYDNKLIIVGLTFLACLIAYFLPILILERKARIKIKSIRYHFPIYLRQIQVLLQNNTVVKSIELSLEYVPDILRDDIVKLNDKLRLEPNNMSHYVNCMKQYDLVEIQRSMKWLYRYQNFGYIDAYSQFNRMLISTSKWLRQSRIENKNDSIQVYQWMGMLPLIGVTFVFISAMMSVVISLFERG
jgi:hypothetical protein